MEAVLVILLFIIVVAICMKPGATTKRSTQRTSQSKIPITFASSVKAKTVSELHSLIDERTAGRLVFDAKQRYPGKPEQWYWEKVIHDLERDRRA